ncbi:4-coumarate--CoA ligase 1-like isoform X3 [Daphnia pulicaria]|uniref:4-coumarate--CoA ligase 1-like isoform X3 n=1 Tax=Daphnia pulicaria TaxID=35523 RepID=UPI001EEA9149|nr:4-coumarate--CoA ligase 1-like isoform X3 [Daphnia pulicaria]XP_046655335.1 4-coumarate--CoA ligase 1-like isoform X3 [Daphnia pulicaria]
MSLRRCVNSATISLVFVDISVKIDSDTKQSLSYNEICENILALAAGLQLKLNLKPGEIVAVALPTCLEYSITVLALNLCGATSTLINPGQTISELTHCVQLTKPKLWVGTDSFSNKFSQLYPDVASRPPMILFGSKTSNGLDFAGLIESGRGKTVQPVGDTPLDMDAFILFSSGTTGVPKGVVLTNLNYVVTRKQSLESTKISFRDPEDVTLFFMPLYHAATLNGLFECFMRGLRFVLMPNFTFELMLQSIQEFKITLLFLVPAIAVQLLKHPVEKHYDLTSLKMLRSGAAAISKDTLVALAEKFGVLVLQLYGLTEATLCTHGNTFTYNRDGSIGVVAPFCESKIVDTETGEALGPNQEGEICVRGPIVMKGYIGNEAATKETVDTDGWLHSGDVGYYDEDGFFFITDRKKELIKFKGLQVSPTELEKILLGHPDIQDAAVAPVPDEAAGELPRAYIIKRPGSAVTENDIAKFIADQVSAHKRLRGGVVFVDSIPKTATGKIMRRQLKTIKSKL